MQTVTATKPNLLAKLHDELIAAIRTFRRTSPDPKTGEDVADDDNGQVSALGDAITIHFADDIAAADVTAVVAAHDLAPPPLTQPEQRRQRMNDLIATGRVAWTPDERDELLELVAQEALHQ